MHRASKLFVVLPLLGMVVWTGCSSDNPVRGTSCRTDGDCSGGLCQAGICIPSGSLPDATAEPTDAAQDASDEDDGLDADADADVDADLDTDSPDAPLDAVTDVDGANACGGTAELPAEPGDPCGVCDDGEIICAGPDAVRCEGASELNVCGGCGPLPGVPGAPCDACEGGVWRCDESGDLICSCLPEPDGTCAAPFPLELGSPVQIDLCEAGDDEDPVAGSIDCRDVQVRGEDVVYTFRLPETTTVTVDARDDDSEGAIDTVVYVRSDCEEPSSQIICSDDVPCEESVVEAPCTGSVQVRQSTIQTELEAGTYFLVADSFNYVQTGVAYGCGTVRIEVSE